jgi:hypothetical protein
MALLNFHRRFVSRIKDGSKTHTIRGKRKRPIKAGETLHLYTGLRHKGAELIMRAPCARVEDIKMVSDESHIAERVHVFIEGVELDRDEKEAFARRDGFDSFCQMIMDWWNGLLPFNGDVIHWKNPGEN